MVDLMASVEAGLIKKNTPALLPGDTVRVHAKVVEGTRERIQVFEGVVMRMRKDDAQANFTVRRISHGVGVERTFLMNSPRVDKIEVMRHGHVRRAQALLSAWTRWPRRSYPRKALRDQGRCRRCSRRAGGADVRH